MDKQLAKSDVRINKISILLIVLLVLGISYLLIPSNANAAPVVLWQENFDNVTQFSPTRIFNTNQSVYNFGLEWGAPSQLTLSTNTALNAGGSAKSLRGVIEKPIGSGGGAI
jgi:hypothetical protein